MKRKSKFFDGWNEAKAEGPEAERAWEQTPVTQAEINELIDRYIKPRNMGISIGWVILLKTVALPILKKVAASMPEGVAKDVVLAAIAAMEVLG